MTYLTVVTVPKGGCCGGDLTLYLIAEVEGCEVTFPGKSYNSAIQLHTLEEMWDGKAEFLPQDQLQAVNAALEDRPEFKGKNYVLRGLNK